MATQLRGTSIQVQNASSSTISLPAGSIAGDTAVLFVSNGQGVTPTTPTGWTVLSPYSTGTNWDGAIYSKLLTSGDISTGSVTVSFASTFWADMAMAVVYSDTAATVVLAVAGTAQNGSNATSATVSFSKVGLSGDQGLYFCSNEVASSTDTCNRGTVRQSWTTGVSGYLFTEALTAPINSVGFTYSASAPNYAGVVVASDQASHALLTQLAREVAISGNPAIRFTQLAREVAIPLSSAQQPIIQVIT